MTDLTAAAIGQLALFGMKAGSDFPDKKPQLDALTKILTGDGLKPETKELLIKKINEDPSAAIKAAKQKMTETKGAILDEAIADPNTVVLSMMGVTPPAATATASVSAPAAQAASPAASPSAPAMSSEKERLLTSILTRGADLQKNPDVQTLLRYGQEDPDIAHFIKSHYDVDVHALSDPGKMMDELTKKSEEELKEADEKLQIMEQSLDTIHITAKMPRQMLSTAASFSNAIDGFDSALGQMGKGLMSGVEGIFGKMFGSGGFDFSKMLSGLGSGGLGNMLGELLTMVGGFMTNMLQGFGRSGTLVSAGNAGGALSAQLSATSREQGFGAGPTIALHNQDGQPLRPDALPNAPTYGQPLRQQAMSPPRPGQENNTPT